MSRARGQVRTVASSERGGTSRRLRSPRPSVDRRSRASFLSLERALEPPGRSIFFARARKERLGGSVFPSARNFRRSEVRNSVRAKRFERRGGSFFFVRARKERQPRSIHVQTSKEDARGVPKPPASALNVGLPPLPPLIDAPRYRPILRPMIRTDSREGQGHDSFGRWLLALLATVMLASTLLLEWARMHGR